MPRTARIVVDDGTYHVLTQGNNNQAVFHQDTDYERYLALLSTYIKNHRLFLYHYVLMPNHVHLVLQVKHGLSLSKVMSGLNLAYTLYYRKRYQYEGHLWRGRYKSFLIDRDRQLLKYGRCLELNPVHAGLVQDPLIYPWSSYRAYAQGVANSLLARHPLYEALGASPGDRQARYRQFVLEGIKPSQARHDLPQSVKDLPAWLHIPSFSTQRQRPPIRNDGKK